MYKSLEISNFTLKCWKNNYTRKLFSGDYSNIQLVISDYREMNKKIAIKNAFMTICREGNNCRTSVKNNNICENRLKKS